MCIMSGNLGFTSLICILRRNINSINKSLLDLQSVGTSFELHGGLICAPQQRVSTRRNHRDSDVAVLEDKYLSILK